MTGTGMHYRPVHGRAVARTARGCAPVDVSANLVISLFLALAVLLSAMVSTNAVHHSFDIEAPQVESVSKASAQTPDAPSSPTKSRIPGLCTGHCAAHTLTLPATPPLVFIPYILRAGWWSANDQVTLVSRPALLERPPRV